MASDFQTAYRALPPSRLLASLLQQAASRDNFARSVADTPASSRVSCRISTPSGGTSTEDIEAFSLEAGGFFLSKSGRGKASANKSPGVACPFPTRPTFCARHLLRFVVGIIRAASVLIESLFSTPGPFRFQTSGFFLTTWLFPARPSKRSLRAETTYPIPARATFARQAPENSPEEPGIRKSGRVRDPLDTCLSPLIGKYFTSSKVFSPRALDPF